MTREPESIGDLLRLHVDAQYPTHKDAARALGCSPGALCEVMTGRRKPTRRMCDVLGVEPRERWVPKALPEDGMPGLPIKFRAAWREVAQPQSNPRS